MNKVFLNYDQDALDRELNLRKRWPEHTDFLERWAKVSATAYDNLTCRRDLSYGAGPFQKIDLFLPENNKTAAPLLFFIHGGYWQNLDKSDFAFPAAAFLEKGIAFATVNYSLAPEAKIGDMVGEVRRAFAWLLGKARDFELDPAACVICGHSAGGHLATMTGLWDSKEEADAEVTIEPLAIASLSGVYDLEPIRLSYHNAVLGLARNEAMELSPLRHIRRTRTPFYLAVGADETSEFLRQQALFAEKAAAAEIKVAAHEFAGLHHFSIMDALADPQDGLHRSVAGLFGL